MTKWLRFLPKATVGVLGLVDVVIEPARVAGPGPPVSAGRFASVQQLAEETLYALDPTDLRPAADRLMTLADEFPVDQRGDAVAAKNEVRTLHDLVGRVSTDEWQRRADDARDHIIRVVTALRTAAEQAEEDAAGLDPPLRRPEPGQRPSAPGVQAPASGGAVATPPAVECREVCWRVRDKDVVRNLNLKLARGTVVGVVGSNGAGKTTLLRLLAQELRPTVGEVSYPDLAQRQYQRERLLDRIAYVPQEPLRFTGTLETHLLQYTALRLPRSRTSSDEVSRPKNTEDDALRGEVAFAMARFGLGGLADARFATLSGGFKTRVGLARAMLAAPDILILDEPLGPLDPPAQRQYLRHLRDLADYRRKVCVIVTSQDIHAIAEIADQIVALVNGRLVFADSPDKIQGRSHRRSYEFAGKLPRSTVKELLAALPGSELRVRGMTYVVQTDDATSAKDLLDVLFRGGEVVTYFRDLTRSPESLLDEADGYA